MENLQEQTPLWQSPFSPQSACLEHVVVFLLSGGLMNRLFCWHSSGIAAWIKNHSCIIACSATYLLFFLLLLFVNVLCVAVNRLRLSFSFALSLSIYLSLPLSFSHSLSVSLSNYLSFFLPSVILKHLLNLTQRIKTSLAGLMMTGPDLIKLPI